MSGRPFVRDAYCRRGGALPLALSSSCQVENAAARELDVMNDAAWDLELHHEDRHKLPTRDSRGYDDLVNIIG